MGGGTFRAALTKKCCGSGERGNVATAPTRMRLSIALVLVVLIVGCGSPTSQDGSADLAVRSMEKGSVADSRGVSPGEPQAINVSQPEAPAAQATEVLTRDVVRRATLKVRVPNVEKGEREVSALIRRLGGYVETTASSDLETDHPELTMTLRIPVRAFDEALSGMERLGTRQSKTISSEDVTATLVDYEARLKTMTAHEGVLRNFLMHTQDLSQMSEMEGRIATVRGDIESLAAQRKALGELAALSTVTVTLTQDTAAKPVPRDPNWLAEVWGDSTSQFGHVMQGVTSCLIYLVVFSPFWIPVALIAKRSWKAKAPANVARSS